MKRSLSAGVLLVVACGRGGFDAKPDAPADAPAVGPTMKCGADLKFPIGPVDEQYKPVRVVPTKTGFAVFAVDRATALQGWTFDLVDGMLVPVAQRTIGTGLGEHMGAVAKDDQILIAVREAELSITGNSRLYSLGPDLAERNMRALIDLHVTEDPLALDGEGKQIAMLDIESGGNVRVRTIDVAGDTQGFPQAIIPGFESPEWLSIATGTSGYVVSWTNKSGGEPCPLIPDGSGGTTARACNRMLVLDRDFKALDGPLTTSDHPDNNTHNTIGGSAASSGGYYMSAWSQKVDGGGDVVRYQIRNAETGDSTGVKELAFPAQHPRVHPHATGFFVTVMSGGQLVAETIAFDGTVAHVPVLTTPGVAPLDHTLVERNGQTVTTWIEPDTGKAPLLRFQAICPRT